MTRTISLETWWHGKTNGQRLALAKKLYEGAGDNDEALDGLDGLVRDELTVQVVFKDATVLLVDKNGRCIPIKGMNGGVVDANRDFRLVQPEINYGTILTRLQQFFAPEMKFVSVGEFESRSKALIAKLAEDKQSKNLLKGVYLPLVFPQLTIADYGHTLEDVFLAAVKRSYEEAFPGRPFTNHRKNTLAGQVKIVDGTRHEKLLAMMADGPVVGLWFANPLQGFSIPACREQIAAFQNGILLSGAIDTATAWVADPKTIARDWNTPGNDCASMEWQSADYSLFFKASDAEARFANRYLLAHVFYSGSVVFVG